ncbi:hypothetical protein JZK55_19860 [Dissulfurispira thermophila]|uniref:DUF5615 domain-containing protein n=2 Tax=root TaxID=1 RepID=A0A7G1H2M5_9BACT|nr:DUF5615 family PIN-like protein [Dissulfurispira thermophila]BCB97064.1 hypothetical protein JZK55_19860 [Dissulfurispira thermophila]
MHLKLLADESLDFRIVLNLKEAGFEIISVLKDYQGASDRKVLELSKTFNAIIITEDKDFGEWIFAHKEKSIGVIFLRYNSTEFQKISSSLIILLKKFGTELYGKFTVVTIKKIRIRTL